MLEPEGPLTTGAVNKRQRRDQPIPLISAVWALDPNPSNDVSFRTQAAVDQTCQAEPTSVGLEDAAEPRMAGTVSTFDFSLLHSVNDARVSPSHPRRPLRV